MICCKTKTDLLITSSVQNLDSLLHVRLLRLLLSILVTQGMLIRWKSLLFVT